MISIENAQLSYGDKMVLNRFSLSFPKKGITALSGPSGSGKTSLMRAIAGLQPLEGGQIQGIDLKRTAFLFQENRLLPWRTVREHITDVLPPQRRDQADFFLELVHLEKERSHFPGQLSGGMARRLAFARCMALEADLYLLDEPFTGVDLERTRGLMDYLAQLSVPVLLSSHEPEVLALAHRCVRLDGPPLCIL